MPSSKSSSQWPPAPIVQKLYQSRQIGAFDPDQVAILTADLGYYCDLQSVHSEDAITWSFFGTCGDQAVPVLNWLTETAGLEGGDSECSVSLWRRIPHPDTLVSGGPEIDAVLIGDRTVIAVEAKWMSSEGKKQGKAKDKTQLRLRNEYFAKHGRQVFGPDRTFVVAALGVLPDDLELPQPLSPQIKTVALTWDQLCHCEPHPRRHEYQRYYQWKLRNSKWKSFRRRQRVEALLRA